MAQVFDPVTGGVTEGEAPVVSDPMIGGLNKKDVTDPMIDGSRAPQVDDPILTSLRTPENMYPEGSLLRLAPEEVLKKYDKNEITDDQLTYYDLGKQLEDNMGDYHKLADEDILEANRLGLVNDEQLVHYDMKKESPFKYWMDQTIVHTAYGGARDAAMAAKHLAEDMFWSLAEGARAEYETLGGGEIADLRPTELPMTKYVLPDLNDVSQPEYTGGEFLRAGEQFLIPYMGSLKVLKGMKVASQALSAKAVANWDVAAAIKAPILEGSRYALAGAMTDFTFFDPQQTKINDVLNQIPGLKWAAIDFLCSDPEDGWMTARLKNMIEGLYIGEALGLGAKGIFSFFKGWQWALWSKNGMSKAAVAQDVQNIIGDAKQGLFKEQPAGIGKDYTREVFENLEPEKQQAFKRVVFDSASKEGRKMGAQEYFADQLDRFARNMDADEQAVKWFEKNLDQTIAKYEEMGLRPAVKTLDDLEYQLRLAFDLSDSQSKAARFITEAWGKTSAKLQGITLEEWLQKNIRTVRRGGISAKDALFSMNTLDDWMKNVKAGADEMGLDVDMAVKHMEHFKKLGEILRERPELLREEKIGQAVQTNMDYGSSLEINTNCPKREKYEANLRAIEVKMGRPMTADELFGLATIMEKEGKVGPCIYCYVESNRRNYNESLLMWHDKRKALNDHWNEGGTQDTKALAKQFKTSEATIKELYAEWKAGGKYEDIDLAMFTDAKILENASEYQRGLHGRADRYAKSASSAKLNVPTNAYTGEFWFEKWQKFFKENMERAGQRIFSSTDAQVDNIIDYMQAVVDLAMQGQKAHCYTKQPWFARVMGNTGMKINMSVFVEGDAKTGFKQNTTWGMPWKDAQDIRGKFNNAGTIMVTTNDEQLEWALKQDWVDMIIPWHRSGMPKAQSDFLDFVDIGRKNHESWNTKNGKAPDWARNKDEYERRCKEAGVEPEWDEGKAHPKLKIRKGSVGEMSQNPMWEGKGEGKIPKIVYKSHQNNVDTYKKVCKVLDLNPRFAEWIDHPSYMRLVNDIARADTPHEPIKAIFDYAEAETAVRQWQSEGGYTSQRKADEKLVNKIYKRLAKREPLWEGSSVRDIPSRESIPVSKSVSSQKIGSADTSLNQVAATFKKVKFAEGTRNLDLGGGKYDAGTEFLKGKGVENHVYDPFNRSAEHNEAILNTFKENPADTVTVNNVLNVIQEPEVRAGVIEQSAQYLKKDGKTYFLIHEGDASGVGKVTKKDKNGNAVNWQNNMKAAQYLEEISAVYGNVKRSGNLITASNPKLFKKEAGALGVRGSAEFLSDGRAIIRSFKQPDVFVAMHELGHVFRRDLPEGELREAERILGVKDGVWTREAEEKFAESFEKYLREGKAPNKELQSTFSKFKEWFIDLYRNFKEMMGLETSKEIDELFDRMLTGDPRRAIHEMNAEDYVKYRKGVYSAERKKALDAEFQGGERNTVAPFDENAARREHAGAVLDAVRANKAVSEKVLKDYPEYLGEARQRKERLRRIEGQTGKSFANGLADHVLAIMRGDKQAGQLGARALDAFNYDNMGSPEEIKRAFNYICESVDSNPDYKPLVDRYMSFDRIEDEAANLGMTVSQFQRIARQRRNGASQLYAMRCFVEDYAEYIRTVGADAIKSGDRLRVAQMIEHTKTMANLALELRGVVTDTARALAQQRMFAQARGMKGTQPSKLFKGAGDLNDAEWLKNLTRDLSEVEAKDYDKMVQMLESFINAPNTAARMRQAQIVANARMIPWRAFVEFMQSNLVSSIPTNLTNIMGNAVHAANLVAIKSLAVAGHLGAKGDFGQFKEFSKLYAGALMEGLSKALKMGTDGEAGFVWKALKTGQSQMDAARAFENTQQGALESYGKVGTALSLPFRPLVAMDDMFRSLNFQMELSALAFEQAYRAGNRGEALFKEARNLMGAVDHTMVDNAMVQVALDRAAKATFNDNLPKHLQSLSEWMGNTWYGSLMRGLFMPFFKVPVNIIRRTFEELPTAGLDFGKMISKDGWVKLNFMKDEYKAIQARGGVEWAEVKAKWSVGAMIMSMGGLAEMMGLYNSSALPAETQAMRNADRMEQSFQTSAGQFGISNIGPVAMLFSIGANLYRLGANVEDFSSEGLDKLAGTFLLLATKPLTTQSMLKGVNDIADMFIYGRIGSEEYWANRAKAVVPFGSFVASGMSLTDDNQRMMYEIADGIKQMYNRGELLVRRHAVYGTPLAEEYRLIPGVYSRSPDRTDATGDELLRLGVSTKPFDRTYTKRGEKVQYTKEQYDALWNHYAAQDVKGRLEALFESDRYKRLGNDDYGKSEAVKKIITKARDKARHRLVRDYPDLKEAIRDQLEERKDARNGGPRHSHKNLGEYEFLDELN